MTLFSTSTWGWDWGFDWVLSLSDFFLLEFEKLEKCWNSFISSVYVHLFGRLGLCIKTLGWNNLTHRKTCFKNVEDSWV